MKWVMLVLLSMGLVFGTGSFLVSRTDAQDSKGSKASAKADDAKEKKKSGESDKKGGSAAKGKKEERGNAGVRLPRFFGGLVDDAQREKILAIREKHQEKIAELRKQLAALQEKEMDEMEAVLTPAQRKELESLRAEGAKDAPAKEKSEAKKSNKAEPKSK